MVGASLRQGAVQAKERSTTRRLGSRTKPRFAPDSSTNLQDDAASLGGGRWPLADVALVHVGGEV